jgi:hypothetical protein
MQEVVGEVQVQQVVILLQQMEVLEELVQI